MSQKAPRLEVPNVGMRGGLGRTLLTAFLILAILPLSIVSWYATNRSRLNIQQEVIEKLNSIAALKGEQFSRWVEEQIAMLTEPALVSQVEASLEAGEVEMDPVRVHLTEIARQRGFLAIGLVDPQGQVVCASDSAWEGERLTPPPNPDATLTLIVGVTVNHDEQPGLVIIGQFPSHSPWPYIAARTSPEGLKSILEETAGLGQTGNIYLVDHAGTAFPMGQSVSASDTVQAALAGGSGEGLYENYAGVPVIGVYRWLPAFHVALFVEQSQEEAFAGNDAVATAVIAATLGVALATAAIAAFVTRQVTRPVVRLTESALLIAGGDLSQRVEVTSRDEIGILANVFNRMAGELETLYEDLEAKVAERTQLLQQANYQIQRRAIQMQASLEVGQAATSILDPDRLLEQVVRVVRDRFLYSYVAVYTTTEGESLQLRAAAGEPAPTQRDPASITSGPVGQAFQTGEAIVESHPVPVMVGPPATYTRSEAALPMRLGDHILGVLYVQSTEEEGFDQDDVSVLQNAANQITIALENARAYAVEREAAERLRELDRSKRRFLANMSHELRTPLTNIIGFSRLMLKGIGGPLTEQQQNDLQIIYHNGQHLLGLINDLLDISQIEAGLMELELRQVDLSELIHSVMATASALVRDKEIALREELPPDLPVVRADPARIRQVLLRLLANAAKFTEQGEIRLCAWVDNEKVYISVSDTGIGIPPQDRERIFERFEQGTLENGRRPNGAGLGLALSKEFVEMHGGQMWLESEVGKGSTFTFSLPLSPSHDMQGASDRLRPDGGSR